MSGGAYQQRRICNPVQTSRKERGGERGEGVRGGGSGRGEEGIRSNRHWWGGIGKEEWKEEVGTREPGDDAGRWGPQLMSPAHGRHPRPGRRARKPGPHDSLIVRFACTLPSLFLSATGLIAYQQQSEPCLVFFVCFSLG
jgi:hypothetical protein